MKLLAKQTPFWTGSIKTRLILLTLAAYLLGFWSLEFYATRALREEMQEMLGAQQLSTARFIAAEINDNLRERISGLESVASAITPEMIASPPALQSFLDDRHLIQAHFNGGIFVMSMDGTAIADIPHIAGRIGTNYMDRKYAIGALRENKATVGAPLFGRALKSTLVTIAVPVRDQQGNAIGGLAGVTDLAKPNFLDAIGANTYSRAGGYLLVSPETRMIVTASDKKRTLEMLAPPGVNPEIDRFIGGAEGHQILHNPAGVEMLVGVARISLSGWYVASTMPTSEALAPIKALEDRIHVATALLTLIVGLFMWWLLRRELAPLSNTAVALAAQSRAPGKSTPLSIARPDEIGMLIASFNRLLAELRERQAVIEQSETRYRRLIENSPDIVYTFSSKRGGIYFSGQVDKIFGYTTEFLRAHPLQWQEAIHPDDRAVVARAIEDFRQGNPFKIEYRIRDAHGDWRWLYDRSIGGHCEGDELMIEGLAMDITESKAASERIRHLAYYEQLTGLPNRRLLIEKLQAALASAGEAHRFGALLYIDLDNFKTVNDTLGHEIGDTLLRQAAARIVSSIGGNAFAASFGADDFAVIACDLGDNPQTASDAAKALGQVLLASLRQIFEIGEYRCRATASIGIAVFGNPKDTSDDLLKRVDLAMYKAKESGRDTLRLFDEQMQRTALQRAQLEEDLRVALEQGQFELHIQAQFNAALTVVGAEALLRWNHPVRGLVTPDSFISLAEQTGLILPIGRWVMQNACAHLRAWARHPVLRNVNLAVNISTLQLYQADFVEQTLATIRQTDVDPNRLKLEITESLLLENVEIAITRMKALREQGVRFSLDDFGTGYSSLSYLNRLPLDQLKIDQSFVRGCSTDPDARAITRGIISLGTSLGLEVIAEGVETNEQLSFLKQSGCGLFQGYFLSKPLPVAGFVKLCETSGAMHAPVA